MSRYQARGRIISCIAFKDIHDIFQRCHVRYPWLAIFSESVYGPLGLARKQLRNHPAVLYVVAQLYLRSFFWSGVEMFWLLLYDKLSPTITFVTGRFFNSFNKTIGKNGIKILIHVSYFKLFAPNINILLWQWTWFAKNNRHSESNNVLVKYYLDYLLCRN